MDYAWVIPEDSGRSGYPGEAGVGNLSPLWESFACFQRPQSRNRKTGVGSERQADFATFVVVRRKSAGVCALSIRDPCSAKLFAGNACANMGYRGMPAVPLASVLIALVLVRQERSVITIHEQITTDI